MTSIIVLAVVGGLVGCGVPTSLPPVQVVPSATIRQEGPVIRSDRVRPIHNNPSAEEAGQDLFASMLSGRSVTGVVVGQDGATLLVRQNLRGHGAPEHLYLTDNTVVWHNGWHFAGRMPPHLGSRSVVNLILHRNQVVGILKSASSTYGRVVWSRHGFVAIRPLRFRPKGNPACGTSSHQVLLARVTDLTVWNSARGHLPAGSLVQFGIYGEGHNPLLLGSVEDYGRARCPVK